MKPILLCLITATAGWLAAGFVHRPPVAAGGTTFEEHPLSTAPPVARGATLDERFRKLALRLQHPGADTYGGLPGSEALLSAQWMLTDPAACLAWTLAHGDERMPVPHHLLKAWAKTDPGAALDAALAMGEDGYFAAGEICLAVMETDPTRAQALWDALPDAARKRHDYGSITIALAKASSTAAVAALLKTDGKDWQLKEAMHSLSPAKIQMLTDAVAGLPPGKTRQDLMPPIVDFLAAQDPEAALAWVEAHEPTDAMRQRVVAKMAAKDPAKAVELARTLTGNVGEVRYAITASLAKKDPAAAFEFAVSTPQAPDWRGSVYDFETLCRRQPGESAEAVASRFQFVARQCAERHIPSTELAVAAAEALDDAGLLSWLDAQAPGDHAGLAAAIAERKQLMESPRAAAAFAAESWLALSPEQQLAAGNEPTALKTLANAYAAWAGNEPQAAAAAVLNLPEGRARNIAIANTAVNWFYADAPAATAWLESQPAGPARDDATMVITKELPATDPAAAARLVASLSTPQARAEFLRSAPAKFASPAFAEALRQALPKSQWTLKERAQFTPQ